MYIYESRKGMTEENTERYGRIRRILQAGMCADNDHVHGKRKNGFLN